MGNIKEKVAYLQGLTQGLNVNDHSAEGKLLLNIIDVLDDFAEEVQHMHLVQEDLENYVETIDEDLTDLEEEIYEAETDDEEADFVEVQCPSCHEAVSFDSDVLADDDAVEVTCPYCGEVVYDNMLEDDDMLDMEAGTSDVSFKHGIHPGV
jgi:ribosomal protein S27E